MLQDAAQLHGRLKSVLEVTARLKANARFP